MSINTYHLCILPEMPDKKIKDLIIIDNTESIQFLLTFKVFNTKQMYMETKKIITEIFLKNYHFLSIWSAFTVFNSTDHQCHVQQIIYCDICHILKNTCDWILFFFLYLCTIFNFLKIFSFLHWIFIHQTNQQKIVLFGFDSFWCLVSSSLFRCYIWFGFVRFCFHFYKYLS